VREEALDDSAAPVTPERAAILRLGPHAVAAVRRDHLDARAGEFSVERVAVVSAVADQPLWSSVDV